MKDDLNYRSVPQGYVHCFNTDCPRSADCLRHRVAAHATKEIPYVLTVNPAAYPADAARCPHFHSAQKLRFAWGLSTIFDNLPHKTALLLKRQVRALYTKTTYYRILNKERSLSPAEQAVIARLFARSGVTAAPTYDSYTEEYDFQNREEG